MKTHSFLNTLFGFVILGSVFLFPSLARGDGQGVVITEICPTACVAQKSEQWIEIVNIGGAPVDINGWKFWEDQTNHSLTLVQGNDATLDPGEYALIAENSQAFLTAYPTNQTVTVFDSSWTTGLKKTGEEIGLKSGVGSNAFIEVFSYMGITGNGSLERIDLSLADYSAQNWKEHPSGATVGDINYWTAESQSESPPEETKPEEAPASEPAPQADPGSLPQNTAEPAEEPPLQDAPNDPILANQPPAASFSVYPSLLLVDHPVLFNASASTDPDGDALSYAWDFGDGQKDSGGTVFHTFSVSAKIVATLMVSDVHGAMAVASKNLVVYGKPQLLPKKESTHADTADGGEASKGVPAIIINEFVSDPVSGEKEWIELYNTGTSDADLIGWQIHDGAGVLVSPTTTIEGNGFVVFEMFNKLNNAGDSIQFTDPSGMVADSVTYGVFGDVASSTAVTAPVAGDPYSVARIADGADTNNDSADFAITTTPTKGAPNSIVAPPQTNLESPAQNPPPASGNTGSLGNIVSFQPGDIRINELVSDPADGAEEFVEFYNPNNAAIMLDGWWAEDGSTAKTLLKGSVGGHEFFVLAEPKGSLNNAGDLLRLMDPTGKEIDRVCYGSWNDGNVSDNAPKADDPWSLARIGDGKDTNADSADFAVTTIVTKGSVNIVILPTASPSLLSIPTAAASTTPVIMSEVFPNPHGNDSGQEFIELYNPSSAAANLSGWSLVDASGKLFSFSTTTIAAKSFLLLSNDITGIVLNNGDGDTVSLRSPTGVIAQSVAYSGPAPEAQSYSIDTDDEWLWTATPTPGKSNVFSIAQPAEKSISSKSEQQSSSSFSVMVHISEFLPNPIGSDEEEFIELANFSTSTVDISGFALDDEDGGSQVYVFPEGTMIDPLSYIVFERRDTKIALNNDADAVRLFFPDGSVAEEVLYDRPPEGASYAADENGKWSWTMESTPEFKNVFQSVSVSNSNVSGGPVPLSGIDTTLEQIREYEIGDRVRVQGVVIVLPGILGSQYLYIMDVNIADGVQQGGVQVYQHAKKFPELAVGDLVNVSGELSEIQGETRIKVAEETDIEKIGVLAPPNPDAVPIIDIGETFEGGLARVEGDVTESNGSTIIVDDGTGEIVVAIKKETGIVRKDIRAGQSVSVVGVVSQTKSGYRLLPRSLDDIDFYDEEEAAEKTEDFLAVQTFAPGNDAGSSYGTALASGVLSLGLAAVLHFRGAAVKRIIQGAGVVFLGIIRKKRE